MLTSRRQMNIISMFVELDACIVENIMQGITDKSRTHANIHLDTAFE